MFFAELRGTNEVPANSSTAVGSAFVTIDGNNLVTYEVNIGSLQNPTLSHIHGPIPAGQNAGVKVNFATSASAFSNGRVKGTIQVTDAALATDIKTNPQLYYVNVHTTAFGGGEIRGQLQPAKEYLVSIAGNVTTGAGDKFVTDARVFNPSFTTKAVALVEYLVSGAGGNTNAVSSKTLEIAPRGEAVLDDVTGAAGLNSPGSTGALRITSNTQLAVTSNIYNDQRGATPSRGTFGQFVPAITIANALSRGVIPGLLNKNRDAANPSGFRTNIGFFNPNQGSATVNLTLRDAAGTSLATTTVTLAGLSQQQNAITGYFTGVDLSNAAALTVSFDSTLPVLGYGAVNDNISGDSILVPAQPDVAP
ncbi:MAG TPA: CHRD domain-containing protein [Thermoanaerobaculia bacterium]|nr:CHRD domain-containing protein [Thermoanaerobaculia bacterium]